MPQVPFLLKINCFVKISEYSKHIFNIIFCNNYTSFQGIGIAVTISIPVGLTVNIRSSFGSNFPMSLLSKASITWYPLVLFRPSDRKVALYSKGPP